MARLKDMYNSKIAPALKDTFKYSSPMAIPKLEKIVVSMGVGKAVQDKKFMDNAFKDMTVITGQKPLICKAKKSVSNSWKNSMQSPASQSELMISPTVYIHE